MEQRRIFSEIRVIVWLNGQIWDGQVWGRLAKRGERPAWVLLRSYSLPAPLCEPQDERAVARVLRHLSWSPGVKT